MRAVAIFLALILAACSAVTVVVGAGGAEVRSESDKGVIIKPEIEKK